MDPSAEIRVLVLEGSARERGRAHGETLRTDIQAMIAAWKQDIRSDMGMDPDLFLEQFIAETDFLPAIHRWTPDLLEEVEGIAEGSGAPLNTILARQLSDEEPWFRLEKKLPVLLARPETCSAVGAAPQPGRPALVAQNMDTPAYYDEFKVLLHIKDPASSIEAFVFTIAGKISLAGLNSRGVAICCNTLLQLDYAADGLPEDFVVRGVLAQPTLEGALAFMRRVKHASGQNYVVGGPGQVIDLECSAGSIVHFNPYPDEGVVYHTNHPLVNGDQGIWQKRIALAPPEAVQAVLARSTTHARYETLQSCLGGPSRAVGVEEIRAALSSHEGPVCIDRGSSKVTLGCLIMELSPVPILQLSPGPPCSTPFTTYTFSR